MSAPQQHPPRRLIDVGEIVSMLQARIVELARQLLPNGTRAGNEWCVGSIRGEKGDSLKVHIGRGAKAGWWRDFAGTDKGDALDLIACTLFPGDLREGRRQALTYARHWLGLDGDAAQVEAQRRYAAAERVKSEESEREKTERKRKAAHRLWLSAVPRIGGTMAEHYLRGRGIDLRVLGHQPGALRFDPQCWCSEVAAKLPAMVAGVTDHEGRFLGVHRTYLAERVDGDGEIFTGKAALADPKKTWGPIGGGFIRLWKGESGKGLREAPEGSTLMISEGIEDGLTAVLARPQFYCIAAMTIGNIAALRIPPRISRVIVLKQNDTKAEAIEAGARAMASLLAQNVEVLEATVPAAIDGQVCKDANDLLRLADRSETQGVAI